MIQKIYIDSDETLVSWSEEFFATLNKPVDKGWFNALPRGERNKLFKQVYDTNPRLFLKLRPYLYAESLLNVVRRSGVPWEVLTAVGEHHDLAMAANDKRWCLKTKLGVPDRNIVVVKESKDKAAFAKKGHLLIDDYKRNCEEWEANGGIALWVGSPKPDLYRATKQLNRMLKSN